MCHECSRSAASLTCLPPRTYASTKCTTLSGDKSDSRPIRPSWWKYEVFPITQCPRLLSVGSCGPHSWEVDCVCATCETFQQNLDNFGSLLLSVNSSSEPQVGFGTFWIQMRWELCLNERKWEIRRKDKKKKRLRQFSNLEVCNCRVVVHCRNYGSMPCCAYLSSDLFI